MTSGFLRAVPGLPVEWPYSLQQLQADVLAETGGTTIISLSADLEQLKAAPFYLFPYVVESRPDSDTRTQRVELVEPVQLNGEWRQSWAAREATPAEIAQWDILFAPQPRWVEFGAALIFHPITDDFQRDYPKLFSGLSTGLGQAAQGQRATFIGLWQEGLRNGAITPQLAEGILAVAEPFSLPKDFIEALRPG